MGLNMKKRKLEKIPIFYESALTAACEEREIKTIHFKRLWKHIMSTPEKDIDFDSMPQLPRSLKKLLREKFTPCSSKLKKISHSKDKKTSKLLIELQDGHLIESVVIRHSDTRSGGHTVLCVSSQVGCRMGCTFCATGTMGLHANLNAGEIQEQLLIANRHVTKIRNIVFMGMGEPLDNWGAVKEAIYGFWDGRKFGLSFQHMTVSTVGVISKMRLFSDEFPKVNLALSLHAGTQNVRKQIVPTSKAFTMSKLLDAVDYHNNKTGNKVFIEYLMIGNVNSSLSDAKELSEQLKGRDVIVNLIPYNKTETGHNYEAPTLEQMEAFQTLVIDAGYYCTLRKTTVSGQDIDGACGQLAVKGLRKEDGLDVESVVPDIKRRCSSKVDGAFAPEEKRACCTKSCSSCNCECCASSSEGSTMMALTAAVGVGLLAYLRWLRK